MKIKQLGVTDYLDTFDTMKTFTESRTPETEDEIWLVEHNSVFTQGRAGKPEHLLNPTNIPVVQTDRGGQITYHGIGQAIIYPLIDIRRAKIGVRDFVSALENSTIALLAEYGINAYANPEAPGVYLQQEGFTHKIASLGLKIRKNATYHGIAINVDLDMTPFSYINPCGLTGMRVASFKSVGVNVSVVEVQNQFIQQLITRLA